MELPPGITIHLADIVWDDSDYDIDDVEKYYLPATKLRNDGSCVKKIKKNSEPISFKRLN